MKLLQLTGPFSAGQTINIPAQQNCTYVHIGIQIPRERQPIAYWKERISTANQKGLHPDLVINDVEYIISEAGILEFDGLAELTWNIEFKRDLPMETIIDIVYKIQEN